MTFSILLASDYKSIFLNSGLKNVTPFTYAFIPLLWPIFLVLYGVHSVIFTIKHYRLNKAKKLCLKYNYIPSTLGKFFHKNSVSRDIEIFIKRATLAELKFLLKADDGGFLPQKDREMLQNEISSKEFENIILNKK